MVDSNETFREYLKSLRLDKKYRITKLARLSGISRTYLSQMEHGHRGRPSPEILKKICEPLGVSFYSIMIKAGYYIVDPKEMEYPKKLKDILGIENVSHKGNILSDKDKEKVLSIVDLIFDV